MQGKDTKLQYTTTTENEVRRFAAKILHRLSNNPSGTLNRATARSINRLTNRIFKIRAIKKQFVPIKTEKETLAGVHIADFQQ